MTLSDLIALYGDRNAAVSFELKNGEPYVQVWIIHFGPERGVMRATFWHACGGRTHEEALHIIHARWGTP